MTSSDNGIKSTNCYERTWQLAAKIVAHPHQVITPHDKHRAIRSLIFYPEVMNLIEYIHSQMDEDDFKQTKQIQLSFITMKQIVDTKKLLRLMEGTHSYTCDYESINDLNNDFIFGPSNSEILTTSPMTSLTSMTKPKSPINFDRTIAGVNITENGIKSYTKSFKLGPFQLTLNARESGVLGSISLPGTGVSKRNIKII
jgi:hypothetical protein